LFLQQKSIERLLFCFEIKNLRYGIGRAGKNYLIDNNISTEKFWRPKIIMDRKVKLTILSPFNVNICH